MTSRFDEMIDRHGTNSIKWNLFGDDVLPMWVADADFRSPEPVLEAMRRTTRRGATPAVLRLYDGIESERNFGTDRSVNVLLAFDEGDATMVDAGMAVVAEECAAADVLDDALVEQWFGHRNEVSALEALISKGYVVDTMEISAPWSRLDAIYRDRGWYLENDYLSGEKSKAIRKVLAKHYRQLRPQAHAYVEAFGIPTMLRNAEIGG